MLREYRHSARCRRGACEEGRIRAAAGASVATITPSASWRPSRVRTRTPPGAGSRPVTALPVSTLTSLSSAASRASMPPARQWNRVTGARRISSSP